MDREAKLNMLYAEILTLTEAQFKRLLALAIAENLIDGGFTDDCQIQCTGECAAY